MNIKEMFEAYIMNLDRFKRRSPKFLFMLDENGGYDHQDIAALYDAFQKAIKCVISESMAIIPKLLSDEKADELAAIKWQENLEFFKSQNRDLSLKEIEEYRARWCKNKAMHLQSEYKFLVESQEK